MDGLKLGLLLFLYVCMIVRFWFILRVLVDSGYWLFYILFHDMIYNLNFK